MAGDAFPQTPSQISSDASVEKESLPTVHVRAFSRVAHDVRGAAGVAASALDEIERSLGKEALEANGALMPLVRRGLARLSIIADRCAVLAELTGPAHRTIADVGEMTAAAMKEATTVFGRRAITMKPAEEKARAAVEPRWVRLALLDATRLALAAAKTNVQGRVEDGGGMVKITIEADGEMQRLSVLRKNHADEQYLARRNIRTLPESIAAYEKKLAALEADREAVNGHAGGTITVGNRTVPKSDAQAVLGQRLDLLPREVKQIERIPLGRYRGLAFGIVKYPDYAPEVYLEGASRRGSVLSRDHQGPRAVMNALERIAEGYDEQCQKLAEELGLARSQLSDYEARLGKPFSHEKYFAELSRLRDQLKVCLSVTAPLPEGERGPSVSEIAEQIKLLKSSNAVEGNVQRGGERRVSTCEEPVTRKVRERLTNNRPTAASEVDDAGSVETPTLSTRQPLHCAFAPSRANSGAANFQMH